ncbi:hypothetical protein GMLC_07600 [Geomonas limicola]|uniref:Oxygen sensor histidine kinase NreB n=1 Tax=Geomonas limicola TaxID=2740186 RepID=A0A6V8N406_9BACT|nr:sensor histidine kinase [Geomonas limicola]GFO67181.1 hypothetical protein GMLC_07600 [Geomonas limicola]
MSKQGPALPPTDHEPLPTDELREQVMLEQQLLLEALERSQERVFARNQELVARQRALEEDMLRQLTERQLTESRLAASRRQLASLAAELNLCDERARRQIARQLHDQVVQRLACGKIKLDLALQKRQLPESPALAELLQILQDSMADLRDLSFELSPPILYELGLQATLDGLGSRLAREHGFAFELLGARDEPNLGEELKIVLYQIARELLINVVKHARAARVTVELEPQEDRVRLTVTDDGIGFDSGRSSMGFGLSSVRQRLVLMGGELAIQAAPGKGCRIELSLPTGAEETGMPWGVP